MDFSENNIQRLFGHEAAEDEDPERLKEYYFKDDTYDQIVNDLPLRILVGHKGIGKSALFQIAIDEERQNNRLTILVKPDDIVGLAASSDDFLSTIREWKNGINEIISRKALTSFGLLSDDWRSKLNQYGGTALDYLKNSIKLGSSVDLNPTEKLIVKDFLRNGKISVYIDDLDRGWQGRKHDIHRISALLNAVRDISTESRGIFFRISLRADVYYLVRTSDESTDKIEGSVIWQSWENHEILILLIKRIESFFGREVNEKELLSKRPVQLAHYLNQVMEPRFSGKGHWNNVPMYRVLMSLIRKRPRDLVKLCTLSARNARVTKSEKIVTHNLENVFEEYSQGRLQDTINEYRSELPDIERLLLGMKPAKKEKKTSQGYIYNTDSLLKKIRNIQEQGRFLFTNGSIADEKNLAAFMYKINFITARKDTGDEIIRKYFEESRYLSNKFVEFGFDWEVHPAYRWALQPDSTSDVFALLKPSAD